MEVKMLSLWEKSEYHWVAHLNHTVYSFMQLLLLWIVFSVSQHWNCKKHLSTPSTAVARKIRVCSTVGKEEQSFARKTGLFFTLRTLWTHVTDDVSLFAMLGKKLKAIFWPSYCKCPRIYDIHIHLPWLPLIFLPSLLSVSSSFLIFSLLLY